MKAQAPYWRSWWKPRSLRYQLLARSLLILALLLLLIGVSQYVLMKDFLYKHEAEAIASQFRGFPKEAFDAYGPSNGRGGGGGDNSGYSGSPERTRGPVLFLEDTSYAQIAPNGTFTDISGANEGALAPQLEADEYTTLLENRSDLRRQNEYRVVSDAEGTEQLIVFRPSGGPGRAGGVVQIGKPTAPLKAIVLQQLFIFVGLSLAALAGGLALSMPVMRRTLHPLQQIVNIVERTDAGNLNERFPSGQGQEEIERLASSFNGMLGRLEASFEAEREAKEQMRRFIADASHELRTPLTSIHGFLEVLLRGAADKREQLYTALHSMHNESTRIKKLVEDLLMLAKLERAPQLQLHSTRLDNLIRELEPHLRMLAGTRQVRFELSQGITGNYDSDKLKQILLNLFHNAVQHTDPDRGVVSIRLSESHASPGLAYLEVTDNGEGISEEHLPHVFDRFYRSDTSRTRKSGGSGLGLSISRTLAEAHHGTIEVVSQPGEGTTFTVRLPTI
jgi:two-component system, OmpR family, sensor kinase